MDGSPLDPVELLEAAVRIPSPSGSEAEVARFLAGKMASFCLSAGVDGAGNAVGEVGEGPLRIVFLGHLDTVAGEVPVRREGGKLYGRGTVDAKGPFCAAIAAASRLPPWALERVSVVLIGAVEEEAPSSKGARYAVENYGPPRILIAGEPSGWQGITLGYKGRLVVELVCTKGSHHTAGSERSAAEETVGLWQLARDWAQEHNQGRERLFERVQPSLQAIESWDDGLEQGCKAVIGLRLPPSLSPGEAQSNLQAALRGSLPPGARLTFRGAEEPFLGERDNELTRALRTAIRQEGGRPAFKLKTGTSDLNVVAPHWPVPAVAYGPGDSSLDHTPTEHVSETEVRLSVSVLERALLRLAQSGAPALRAPTARSSS